MKENIEMEFDNVTYGVKLIFSDESSKTFNIKVIKFDMNSDDKFTIISDIGNINIITSEKTKKEIDSCLEEYLSNLNKYREKHEKKENEYFLKLVEEICNKK